MIFGIVIQKSVANNGTPLGILWTQINFDSKPGDAAQDPLFTIKIAFGRLCSNRFLISLVQKNCAFSFRMLSAWERWTSGYTFKFHQNPGLSFSDYKFQI